MATASVRQLRTTALDPAGKRIRPREQHAEQRRDLRGNWSRRLTPLYHLTLLQAAAPFVR